ncbi:unnamed protein product, partial [Timema podura]|nr:unnamed protein product [Timema podura]
MTREPMATPEEPDQWLPVDTLMCVSIIVLLFIMATLVGKVTFDHFCRRRVKTGHKQTLRRSSRRNPPKKHIGFRNKNYEKVSVTDLDDDNDDDIALKAMGIRQTPNSIKIDARAEACHYDWISMVGTRTNTTHSLDSNLCLPVTSNLSSFRARKCATNDVGLL